MFGAKITGIQNVQIRWSVMASGHSGLHNTAVKPNDIAPESLEEESL